MKNIIKCALPILLFFFIIGLIFACVESVCCDISFYRKQYSELGSAEKIGMSEDDLLKATEKLFDYMRGYEDDIYIEAEVNGVNRAVFDERETTHMVDVRNLFISFIIFKFAVFAVTAVAAVMLIAVNRLKGVKVIAKSYVVSFAAAVVLLGVIGIWASVDFNSFWNTFHGILFTNDLWLLDPRVSIMINMLPGKLFFAMIVQIIIRAAIAILIPFAASVVFLVYSKKKNK